MGHRVIGLTRSGTILRAAVVETRLRRFELRTVLEIDLAQPGDEVDEAGAVDASDGLLTVGEALNRALVPPLSPSDSVVVAYPGDAGFIRRLSFPFRDRARISEVLPVELGGTLPTGLDTELHVNFERAGKDGNDIIAVGVQAQAFASWLDGWRFQGIDPKHVAMESLELAAYLPFIVNGEPANRMIVSVDGNLVEFMVASGDSVRLCRAIRLQGGIVSGGDLSGAFMREVLLCVAAASEAGTPLDSVFACGDHADVVARVLSESIGIQCDKLDPLALGIPGAADCDCSGTAMSRTVALAIGVADGSGPAALNLRTGQFGSGGAAGLLREKAMFFSVALGVFLLLGAGWTATRYIGLVGDRAAIEKQLVVLSSTILERQVDDFEGALAEVRAGSREELALFPAWTGAGTLEKITRAVLAAGPAGVHSVPAQGTGSQDDGSVEDTAGSGGESVEEDSAEVDPGHSMELEQIEIGPKQAMIKGEAESIEKVDELIARLRGDACFHEIVTESTERVQFQRHQGWQKFRVRMNVDCVGKDARKGAPATGAAATPGAAPASPPVQADSAAQVDGE